MTDAIRFGGVVFVGIGLLATATDIARGGCGGGHGGSDHGGCHRGYGWYGGWGGYPVVAFSSGWTDYYYDYPPTYYYAPATVVAGAQPGATYSSPTVNYEPQRPAQPAVADSAIAPAQPNGSKPAVTVADIKALSKSRLTVEVILSQLRRNQAVFHLTPEEILDLNTNQVSPQVIDFMIHSAHRAP